jgi:hypothetical protein
VFVLPLPLQELFYEGSGSNAELILSLILAATLVYIPITIAIVGKRLWIKYRSAAELLSCLWIVCDSYGMLRVCYQCRVRMALCCGA